MIKKIRLLGLDYKIQLFNEQQFGTCDAGQCHNLKAIISLNDCNNSEHMKSVLLHEVLEALNYRLELKLEHPQITALETGFFQLLVDNPAFVKLFLREKKK